MTAKSDETTGQPIAIEIGLSKKTAIAFARAFRAKGRKVYARKVAGGRYSVFEK